MAQLCQEVSRNITYTYRPVVDTIPMTGMSERPVYGPETTGTKEMTQEVCVAGGRAPNETGDLFLVRMQKALSQAVQFWREMPDHKLTDGGRYNKVDMQVTYPLIGDGVIDQPETRNRCTLWDQILGGCGAVKESSNDYRDPKTGEVLNKMITAGSSGSCTPRWTGGVACFSGTTDVLLKDGLKMQLSRLADLNNRGESLPEIASYDTAAGQVVYQQPSHVITHENASGMLYLGLGDGTSPLQVTGNHPMLTRRNGLEAFFPVEDLRPGDCLVSPFGGCASYRPSKTVSSVGAQALYDLSMPGIHNFIVCADDNCYVAHNKPM